MDHGLGGPNLALLPAASDHGDTVAVEGGQGVHHDLILNDMREILTDPLPYRAKV